MFNEIFEFIGGVIDDTTQLFAEVGTASVELVEGLASDTADGIADTFDTIVGDGKHSDKNILERAEYLLVPECLKENSLICHAIHDHVTPKKGSILRCELACGLADHTGVYIGYDQIVELNGSGKIKTVSYGQFLSSSSIKTGISIYVACDKDAIPLSDSSIANYAKSKVGQKVNYDSASNNCHGFTSECIMQSNASSVLFHELESVISKEMNYNDDIKWRVWDK